MMSQKPTMAEPGSADTGPDGAGPPADHMVPLDTPGTPAPTGAEKVESASRVYEVVEPVPAVVGSTAAPMAGLTDMCASNLTEPASVVVGPVNMVEAQQNPLRRIGWRTVVRWAMGTAALFAVAAILWSSGSALTPFIIGLVMAYLMLPLVNRLDGHMPRWAAILIVYGITFGSLGIALAYIIPAAITQISQVIESIPGWYNGGREEVERLFARFQREAPEEVRLRVQEQLQQIQQTAEANATAYASSVGAFLFNSVRSIFGTLTFLLGFLIIPFFLFYILMDTSRMPDAINRMLHPRIRADFWNTLRIVDSVFGKYIRGQLILGLIVGIMSFIGLQALNLFTPYEVRFTLLLALVAAVGELIPVIGPIISAIPAIIVGSTDGFDTALAVTVLYVLIQQIENQVLVPRIVGNTLKLHAAILMALLVIASQVGGLFLVILVAPLTAIIRDIFVYYHQRLQEPPVAPDVAIAPVLAENSAD